MGSARDLSEMRFGRLVAKSPTNNRIRGSIVWRFQCDCGDVIEIPSANVTSGKVASCGCIRRERGYDFMTINASKFNSRRAKHGESGSRTYSTWLSMKTRCCNPNSSDFNRYGGRGIKICARWNVFENFLADMGDRPDGYQIDRWPNNNGDYEPGNCRWATPKQNMNNRRVNKSITFDGRTMNVKEWALEFGRSHQAISYRLKAGWSVEKALTTPIATRGIK